MSKRSVLLTIVLVASSTWFGCSAPEELGELGQSRQAQQALEQVPNSGFIPYPIKVNQATGEPILNPDGSHQPAWDGTLADLMAADAYALCAREGSFGTAYRTSGGLDQGSSSGDTYLEHLATKMNAFECVNDPAVGAQQWLINRATPQCNVDPQSNEPAVIEDFVREERPPYESFYTGKFGMTATPNDVFEVARRNAGFELEYGDLNLCMAQRLREQLNGGESLFLPTKDHAEIVGVIRERAQLAVIWYSLITKVFSSNNPPLNIDAASHEFLALIKNWWTPTIDNATRQRIGDDFVTAVRLHIQSVHELAALLQREAATRPIGEAGLDRADRDWGIGQPRIRLLNLLYGGDPLGSPPGSVPPPGRGLGGVSPITQKVPAYVKVDMRDPRVRTLLGLARQADALLMKIKLDPGGAHLGFDESPSGERLYQQVEVMLRRQACEREAPGDPACAPSALEAQLPALTNFEQYLLWQEHRVEPRHALTLATAFDQMFGNLANTVDPDHPGLHLLGAHSTESINGSNWVHIDKDFATAPRGGHELMKDFDLPTLQLTRTIRTDVSPGQQGFYRSNDIRSTGAVQALILAREAALDTLSVASTTPIRPAAATVFQDVEREIGQRHVSQRRHMNVVSGACPSMPGNASGAQCNTLVNTDTVDLQVVTTPTDTFDRLTRSPPSPQLQTIAGDPGTVGFELSAGPRDRNELDALSTTLLTNSSYSATSFAAGYQKRTTSYTDDGYSVELLRGNGGGSQQEYLPLFLPLYSLPFQYTAFTSFGGNLHAIAERAMSVLDDDWSRPAFDAFGLPVDWVPPADASLVGGAPGEPSYQYYLREAKQAAQEATTAVQVAIDSLVDETLQTVDLEAAEERAATISDIEMRSLCGPSSNCDVPTADWAPPQVDCYFDQNGVDMPPDARRLCEQAMAPVKGKLPAYFPLALIVIQGSSLASPTFPEFQGSKVQSILIRQWNAKRALELAISNAAESAKAFGYEAAAATAALQSAAAEKAAAQAAIDAEIAQLDNTVEISALIAEMEAAKSAIDTKLTQAEAIRDRECSDQAYEDASQAGASYAGANRPGNFGVKVKYNHDGMSWSSGPLYAQLDRCTEADDQVSIGQALAEPDETVLQLKIEALIAKRDVLTPQQRDALTKRRSAAEQTHKAAKAAEHASKQSAWAQLSAQLAQVQQATGELLAASAELGQAQLETENALASANLERDLVEKHADARFGIQRKFRSYDMWRARALLESARRLAVAARRAIEERFVVDLSDLDAPQAFVAAPSIWADEVYAMDLNAPSVVGLSVSPAGGNGLYPNQLIDYVNNLQSFVQGYTVTYPTSVALPDTEALVIPGPNATEAIEANGATTEVLSGDALGWTFFCSNVAPSGYPTRSGWFQHPLIGGAEVVKRTGDCDDPPVAGAPCGDDAGVCPNDPTCHCESGSIVCGLAPPAQRLDELCNGKPPTRARYSSSLDAWGRLNRGIRSTPLEQRHNVRWRRLAVNLVGTGIRDCQRAAGPASCFSESFLRFQLQHAGPAWMTNYAQEWRAFDLPTAFIEGGKALASEEWLDPLVNNWSAPFVAAVARGELMGRPIYGAYELILELGPEVRLDRIEQLQLLVETDYWVRQQ